MKAQLEINEAVLRRAVLEAFKDMRASDVKFKSTPYYDAVDRPTGAFTISATVTIEVDTPIAFSGAVK